MRKGSKQSFEAIEKIRAFQLGRKHPHTEETKARQREISIKLGLKPPNQTGKHWGKGESVCNDCKQKTKSWYAKRCGACHYAYYVGKKHPAWQGGVSTLNQRERLSFNRHSRGKVFKRDAYTCQICGSQKDLQVDHIKPWSLYPKLRFTISNCRTLCASCHYQITYGKPIPKDIKGWGQNLLVVNQNWSLE